MSVDPDGASAAGDAGPAKRTGRNQSVQRAIALLRAVAVAPSDGERLADLAATAGLDRGTAHRILATLVDGGMVEQDAKTKRYHLGIEFFTLASAASNRFDVQEITRTSLERLASLTGDSVFFSVRSNDDIVCLDVAIGSFPIKTLPMDIGTRRPLGAGAPGIAILSALSDEEVGEILGRNADRLARVPGQDRNTIEAGIAHCREHGFAVSPPREGPEIRSVAVAMLDRRQRPISVLSVTAIVDRMREPRPRDLADALKTEARTIEEAMWRMPDDQRHRTSWAKSRMTHGTGL